MSLSVAAKQKYANLGKRPDIMQEAGKNISLKM